MDVAKNTFDQMVNQKMKMRFAPPMISRLSLTPLRTDRSDTLKNLLSGGFALSTLSIIFQLPGVCYEKKS